jgi:predicted phage tail protein
MAIMSDQSVISTIIRRLDGLVAAEQQGESAPQPARGSDMRSRDLELEQYRPRSVVPRTQQAVPEKSGRQASHERHGAGLGLGFQGGGPAADPNAEFQQFITSIKASALALKDIAKKNQEIRADAEASIATMRNQLLEEQARSGALQNEIEGMRAQMKALESDSASKIQEYASTISELRAINVSLSERLELTNRELKSARAWLDYLSAEASSEIGEALAEADRLMSSTGGNMRR